MHTITIKVKKEEDFKKIMKDLGKYSSIEVSDFENIYSNELEIQIEEGLEDIRNGRTHKIEDVLAEARSKYGI